MKCRPGMASQYHFQKFFRIEKWKWLLVVTVVAITHLFCQSVMLHNGKALVPLLPKGDTTIHEKVRVSSVHPLRVGYEPLTKQAPNFVDAPLLILSVKTADHASIFEEALDYEAKAKKKGKQDEHILGGGNPDDSADFVDNTGGDNDMPFEGHVYEGFLSKKSVETRNALSLQQVIKSNSSQSDGIPENNHSITQEEAIAKGDSPSTSFGKPRWSSVRDQEILSAKFQIENTPLIKTDKELYYPLFRNLSMFKRSYEIMERTLKVYVYRDGEKPIFHQPVLKGLYASEGWFMKLMEGNKQFTVRDPRRAHLYYMPFSTRMLEHSLYVRNSHNRTNLRQYLKDYSEKIAARYHFWNRTGGADHFLVACHDWAPYETRHHMEHCIKALCNADVTAGFKIGRDVSLPETYVRSARNPLRDLGGKPPSQRHILAFYAGSLHGYLRPILLEHWKDKEPDIKIFGPMPPGVPSKMNYIQHMKSTKYCICPKGYEVNSPRVVEAIFYECVPVIISDNFVPPFFEVLNWNAFSIILAEKEIPDLKKILHSISEERYLELQLGVRKVQKHFLWHAKPLKYDLFHMTLHSIWYNRVFQIKLR